MDLSHPAADLLGQSPARILLRLSLVNDGLTGRRISELSGVPASTTQRVLNELESIGLVDARDVGRSRLYSLNRRHVLWDPVERMFSAPARVEQIIGETVRTIVGDRASVSLYGSAARGEAGRDSDADIVIIWSDDADATDREAVLAALGERVAESTGNRVELVDLTRDDVRRLAAAGDPLVDSWKIDAKTIVGPDLKRVIRLAVA